MKAIHFQEATHVFAKNQPQYFQLPAYKKNGIVTSCYELTLWEAIKVLCGAKIWVSVMTFDKPLQPQKLSIDPPF